MKTLIFIQVSSLTSRQVWHREVSALGVSFPYGFQDMGLPGIFQFGSCISYCGSLNVIGHQKIIESGTIKGCGFVTISTALCHCGGGL